ncbi:SWIM zinc finger family protein [Bernardetia sp. Wsw4-3y2]|uniref:SWIM zinc finger family protein n=1 Tax=Bernardetia sp. Wsw4-3y2 TaxID=3127471 RepID=UPI0030CFE392
MKITDFEKHIETRFLDRGFYIYEQDYIQEIDTIGLGEFFAIVLGTTYYKVYVQIEEETIIAWNCTCPYDGNICKHVVAVLYYIHDSKMWLELPKNNILDEIESIFNTLSKTEIKNFLFDYFKKNDEIRDDFLEKFRK